VHTWKGEDGVAGGLLPVPANQMAFPRVHKLVDLITSKGEWYQAKAVVD